MKDFEKEIDNIKNKINKIDLDENFKEELSNKLTSEYEKEDKKDKKKIFYFPKQAVAAIFCIVILSSCVFADEIEHFVLSLFPSKDINIEEILENKNLQKIDMEYVEKDGIKIKMDYVLVEKDSIYLAFNVLSEESMDKIYFDKFVLTNEKDDIILNNSFLTKEKYACYNTRLDEKNLICIYKISTNQNTNQLINKLKIAIQKITLVKNNEEKIINNNWIFYVDINN